MLTASRHVYPRAPFPYEREHGQLLDNPYLDIWASLRSSRAQRAEDMTRALLARDRAQLRRLKAERNEYTHRYAYAIPTLEALEVLRKCAPLIEIGAGTGYWAWLLRQLGTDILCYDARPPALEDDQNRFHARTSCWTDVQPGDERKLNEHPARTLFLCWPPPGESMARDTLCRYRGDTFLLRRRAAAAKRRHGSDGRSRVHRSLAD